MFLFSTQLKILMRSGRGGEEAASIVKKAAGSALPKATLPKTKNKTKNASPKKTKVESDNEDDSGSLSDDEEEKTIKMPAKRSSDNIKKTKEAVGNVKQMQERKEEKGLLARQTSKSATGKRDTAPKVAMRKSMNEEDASSPATSPDKRKRMASSKGHDGDLGQDDTSEKAETTLPPLGTPLKKTSLPGEGAMPTTETSVGQKTDVAGPATDGEVPSPAAAAESRRVEDECHEVGAEDSSGGKRNAPASFEGQPDAKKSKTDA